MNSRRTPGSTWVLKDMETTFEKDIVGLIETG
jgi:hypothetical protein